MVAGMSLLQQLNTGGWDQNLVDDLKINYKDLPLVLELVERVEDTLNWEDLREDRDSYATKSDTLEDEISELEDKNEELTKQLGAAKADLACIRMHHNHMGECFGKHKVT